MSGSSEVLTPILLRSSTPAPSEKGTTSLHQPQPRQSDHTLRAPVLLYLEGIARSGGASPVRDSMISDSASDNKIDPNDPRFARLTNRLSSHRTSLLSKHQYNADADGDLEKSELSYDHVEYDDVASNVQEGLRSELARSERDASIHGHEEQEYQDPEPDVVPRPKYESYGSSFGNLGPPRESIFGAPPPVPPAWTKSGTPLRAANWGQTPQPMVMPNSRASVMSPKSTADVNIAIEPPSDPSRSKHSSKEPSRAPSRHSRRSSGGTQKAAEAPPTPQAQAQAQAQLPGITVSIGPDGSTTINIPRGPAKAEAASSEKAPTEVPDEHRSPKTKSRAGTEKPAASMAGSRRPAEGETDQATLLSPETQARALRSPKAGSRAPSKGPSRAASRAPSQMSPIDAFKPWNEYQSFGMPPPLDIGPPSEKAPSMKETSTKAPSQRPASQKAPSDLETIPNEYTGDTGFRYAEQSRGPSGYDGSETGSYADEAHMNGYNNAHRTGATSVTDSSRNGASQSHQHTLAPHNHSRMLSGDGARASRNRYVPPSPSQPNTLRTNADDPLATPTQSRPPSPDELNDYETDIVQGILSARTPRTSIAPSMLAEEIKRSHYHDEDLCILLHAADNELQHEIVRKALRKAVAARIRKLGLKSDRESIKQYRKKFHNHDPSWHVANGPSFDPDDPPSWAREMMDQLASMENRVAALGPQLERLKKTDGSSRTRTQSYNYRMRGQAPTETQDDYERTPRTQHPDTDYTIPGESMGPTTLPGSIHHLDGAQHGGAPTDRDEFEDEETQGPNGLAYTDRTPPTQDGDFISRKKGDLLSNGRGESPGQQVLEQELYRLRVKEPNRSQAAMTHQSWVVAEESMGGDREARATEQGTESEIPDMDEEQQRVDSPPLPALPADSQAVETRSNDQPAWQSEYHEHPPTPPWQRIHQRLLNWAIVWPMTELDSALHSTLRGNQVDEVALSIWSTQMYKRYVRQQLTEVPPGRVDRLFVPPNMADAINNAVFHGRHGDACGMLRDLWTPFGLEGMPRIIVVLCKHRSDPNHWVAHKFSLPDGTLTTYDTYPEKCLPDGRPLGWWFAIRIAWPGALYPSPDHLMQKMVRLHRPMQLDIDNAVAGAGIWRNLLMGSRAERPVDLERLRDLINTEVKNLRQRKEQGKLSVAAAIRQNWNWDDMGN
ncbi:hypothetical protein DFH11DRAFT_1564402 [Phellopilus nigrolimitatus]|nr:hypothetical protein DFH11DRAFT_1564402 [Phellopilus nigrolimitatus]